jgi:hypothetical protein
LDIPLIDEAPHDLIEHARDGVHRLLVRLTATQGFEHLGGELATLHQRPEDGVFQCVEAVRLFRLAGQRVPAPTAESRIEEEIRELVEELLQVQGIEEAAPVLFISGGSHDLLPTVGSSRLITAPGSCCATKHLLGSVQQV